MRRLAITLGPGLGSTASTGIILHVDPGQQWQCRHGHRHPLGRHRRPDPRPGRVAPRPAVLARRERWSPARGAWCCRWRRCSPASPACREPHAPSPRRLGLHGRRHHAGRRARTPVDQYTNQATRPSPAAATTRLSWALVMPHGRPGHHPRHHRRRLLADRRAGSGSAAVRRVRRPQRDGDDRYPGQLRRSPRRWSARRSPWSAAASTATPWSSSPRRRPGGRRRRARPHRTAPRPTGPR